MSKNPFRECVNIYMRDGTYRLADITKKLTQRRLLHSEQVFKELFEDGAISTLSPRKLTERDIEEYYRVRVNAEGRNGGRITPKALKRDLSDIDSMCTFFDNDCVTQFLKRNKRLMQKEYRRRQPSLNINELAVILDYADTVPNEDFMELRGIAMICLNIGAGLRTVELQNATVSNIMKDSDGYFIHLDVVKGQGTYGEPRTVFIIPDFVGVLERYLVARKKFLDDHGMNTDLVFFCSNEPKVLSDNAIRVIRRKTSDHCGVQFDGRKCRRTYGQTLKNSGTNIEIISKNMGHATTSTTEKYYARITDEDANHMASKSYISKIDRKKDHKNTDD